MHQMAGVDDHDTFLGREPELAIARPCAARLCPWAVSLPGLHAVVCSVMGGSNRRSTPVSKVVQIFTEGLIDAIRGADPEIALIVSERARGIVIKQTIPFGVVGHAATSDVESGDPRYPAAEPKASPQVIGY